MKHQPRALALANEVEIDGAYRPLARMNAAYTIRRQHLLIEEMREALKEAVEMFEVTGFASSDGCAMCRAAIAKAEAMQ